MEARSKLKGFILQGKKIKITANAGESYKLEKYTSRTRTKQN